jgi:hypothetical protein
MSMSTAMITNKNQKLTMSFGWLEDDNSSTSSSSKKDIPAKIDYYSTSLLILLWLQSMLEYCQVTWLREIKLGENQ